MGFGRKNGQNPKIKYCFDGVSKKNGRPTNMDSLIVLERTIGQDSLLLAVVSDGVGSLDRGAFAATALTRGLMGWFSTLESVEDIADELCDEMLSINREIYEQSEEEHFKSAATASVLLIVNHVYYTFNAGDSRIYAYQNGHLEQLTQDDVTETGALTEYVGYQIPPRMSCDQGDAKAKTFLLCSDGLYRRMEPEFLCGWLQRCTQTNIHQCVEELVDHVTKRGETDNISVAIIKDCTKG